MADALLSAAEQQLSQELAVARQDASTVSLVRSQLAAFRREMEKEGKLQVGATGGCGTFWGQLAGDSNCSVFGTERRVPGRRRVLEFAGAKGRVQEALAASRRQHGSAPALCLRCPRHAVPAQRDEVARQVAATTKKAAAVVDSMLQARTV